MVKPSEAEKNLVQSNASSGAAGVTGPYGAVDRKLYVGNLHFNMTEKGYTPSEPPPKITPYFTPPPPKLLQTLTSFITVAAFFFMRFHNPLSFFASHWNVWLAEEKRLRHQINARTEEIVHLRGRMVELDEGGKAFLGTIMALI
ncbi:hypothetical protein JHK82_034027 [Glycine max]|nr:hypothetical protein JHK82_034027 [Glycine max]